MKIALIIFTLTVVIINSCGGSKGNSKREPISVCFYKIPVRDIAVTDSTPRERFLPFYDEKGNLYFVDPSGNNRKTLKDTNILVNPLGPKVLIHGFYNGSNQSITDYGPRYLLYVKGGALYMLGLKKGDTSLPFKISSENSIAVICDDLTIPDYSDPERSIYLYYASQDSTCWNGDEKLKLVKLNMDGNDDPIVLGSSADVIPLGVFRKAEDLSISGVILMEKKENGLYDLKVCDVSMSGCSSILPAEFSSTEGISNAGILGNFLYGASFYSAIVIEGKLYIYNGDEMIKPSSSCEFDSSNLKVDQDDTAIYIASGKRIWKFNYSDFNCYLLKEENSTISQIKVGKSRIIYRLTNTIKSINKDNGNGEKTIKTSQYTVWLSGAEGEFVFYNIYGKGIYIAGILKEDGSLIREFGSSFWGGNVIESEVLPYKKTRYGMILVSFSKCPSNMINLGELDKIYRSLYVGEVFRGFFLGKAYINSVTGDIFMFNPEKNQSLVQITNTLELNEFIPR